MADHIAVPFTAVNPTTPLIFQYNYPNNATAVPAVNALHSRTNGALPTNAWWLNLALGQSSSPVACPPYLLRLPLPADSQQHEERNTIEISWPRLHVAERAMWQVWVDDWRLSWRRTTPTTSLTASDVHRRRVARWDDMSVTVDWQSPDSRVTLPLVKSTPYITLLCQSVADLQLDTRHAILSVQEMHAPSGDSNRAWIVTLNNGQTWAVFALPGTVNDTAHHWRPTTTASTLSLHQDGLNRLQLKVAGGRFNGTLRIAGVPSGPSQSASFDLLYQHRAVWPMGGQMQWTQTTISNPIHMQLAYKKMGQLSQPLLMLAQPHHVQTLRTPKPHLDAFNAGNGYRTSKGRMVAVIGDRWEMQEVAPTVQWHGLTAPLDALPAGWLHQIRAALREEVQNTTQPNSTESYWFGKSVARVARLAVIAEQVNEPTLLALLLSMMEMALQPWLDNRLATAFHYDATHGGLLTPAGARGNLDADFGHARYNDHHFHHGYFVYAAAVLGRHQPDWLHRHRPAVLAVCMDYMSRGGNGDSGAAPFPRFRHADLYDGHSWASGLIEFADGRNEESSSEAVHAYYAAALLAEVTKTPQLATDARALLAMELRAAHIYWQMTLDAAVNATTSASNHSGVRDLMPWQASDAAAVYPLPYRSTGTTGVLWSTKSDHATWFGNQPEFIHGIQMLPFTPVTQQLLSADWLRQIDGQLRGALQRSEPPMEVGWRGFLLMAQALLAASQTAPATPERAAALLPYWDQLRVLNGWDNGNSRTNALYWVASLLSYRA